MWNFKKNLIKDLNRQLDNANSWHESTKRSLDKSRKEVENLRQALTVALDGKELFIPNKTDIKKFYFEDYHTHDAKGNITEGKILKFSIVSG